MIIVVGEILYDLFPEGKRPGGAPFNFAFHLKKLGMEVRFVSRVGNDTFGREIMAFIQDHGFDPGDIQVDSHYPTGTVAIHMDSAKGHTFEILKNVAYDYLECDSGVQQLMMLNPDLIYFGSLIQRTGHGQDTVNTLLSIKSEGAKTFCDINLRPDCWNTDSIASSLKNADILKLNEDELYELTPRDLHKSDDLVRCRHLMAQYDIQNLILTLGKDGSCWVTPSEQWQETLESDAIDIVDTVGAGDGFSAMAVAGMIHHCSVPRTLELASLFASKICQIRGALPPSNDMYDEFIHALG